MKLTCKCGWVYFVSADSGGKNVKCPSCGAVKLVTSSGMGGRVPSVAQSAGRPLVLLVVGAVVAIVVVGLALKLPFGESSTEPPEKKITRDKGDGSKNKKEPGTTTQKKETPTKEDPEEKKKTEPKPDPVKKPTDDRVDYHRIITLSIYKLNTAGIVSEILRFRGEKEKSRELQDAMQTYLQEMDIAAEQVANRGERYFMPDYLHPGDRLVRFEGATIGDEYAEQSVKKLSHFLEKRLRANTFADCTVLRGEERKSFTIFWKFRPKEVLDLITYARLNAADDKPPPPREKSSLPSDLLDEVRRILAETHPYYQFHLSGDDRERVDQLLEEKMGYPEEETFLRKVVLKEFAAAVEAETLSLEELAAELRGPSLEVTKSDIVHMKDGQKVEGRIIEETADTIRLEFKRGTIRGEFEYDKKDIAKIEHGQGTGAQFPDRLKKAGTDRNKLEELLGWCRTNRLTVQANYTAYLILIGNPDSVKARRHLGFKKEPAGMWVREELLLMKAGKYKYLGKWYTLKELERRLSARGYVKLKDGLWYTKKRWVFQIENLYRGLDKVNLSLNQGGILDMIESRGETVYDIQKRQWVKRTKNVISGRFIGPLYPDIERMRVEPGQQSHPRGQAQIIVTAPGPLYQCRIKAPGQVSHRNAWIVVKVSNGRDGAFRTLYRLAGKGSNEKTYDVSSVVYGQTKIVISADMSTPYDKNSAGFAMFLPCTKNDRNLLKISGDILEPLKKINKLIREKPGD